MPLAGAVLAVQPAAQPAAQPAVRLDAAAAEAEPESAEPGTELGVSTQLPAQLDEAALSRAKEARRRLLQWDKLQWEKSPLRARDLLAHFHHQNPHLIFLFLRQERELVILRLMIVV